MARGNEILRHVVQAVAVKMIDHQHATLRPLTRQPTHNLTAPMTRVWSFTDLAVERKSMVSREAAICSKHTIWFVRSPVLGQAYGQCS